MFRGGSRTAATSKVELFVTIVNGWNTILPVTKKLRTLLGHYQAVRLNISNQIRTKDWFKYAEYNKYYLNSKILHMV